MKKHAHNDCKHDLQYCKVCNVVYCEKCDSEWKKPFTYQPYTWVYNNETKPFMNVCGHDGTAAPTNNPENLTVENPSNFSVQFDHTEECCPSV
jgi:hypothetical protein